MIKTIVFDSGDVITYFSLDDFRAFIRSRGCDVIKDKEFFKKYKSLYDVNKMSTNEFWDKYIVETGVRASREELISTIKKTISVDLEMKNLLKELKKYYSLILASNIDPVTYEETKRQFGDDLFKKEYLSFKMGKLKSDPSFFSDIISDSSLKPEEVLFVDNSKRNVLSAKSIGLKGLIFINKKGFFKDLKTLGLLNKR